MERWGLIVIVFFSILGMCSCWDMVYQWLLRPRKNQQIVVVVTGKETLARQQAVLFAHQWKGCQVLYSQEAIQVEQDKQTVLHLQTLKKLL